MKNAKIWNPFDDLAPELGKGHHKLIFLIPYK